MADKQEKPVYLGSATAPAQFAVVPQGTKQIAFAGPSNVGKSSLINALLGAKLAHTSKTPGRTQMINFFTAPGGLVFADLPGYGFADVPEPLRVSWQQLVDAYLLDVPDVRGIFLLHDIRRDWTENDAALAEFLNHHQRPWRIILTKADKLKRGTALATRADLARRSGLTPQALVMVSTLKGEGMQETRRLIRELTMPVRPEHG
ncbi:MAG TPA: ribosome biogenesis GTP-binding protein YihA/YsxC [bacterium]|nr:ribosome biogenesis GTP-binding protein YihA/YsxC [bacterium]